MVSHPLTLFIQAGGESRRMGADKSLMPFRGIPLIERLIQRGLALTPDVCILSNYTQKYAFLGLPVIPDPVPGVGPLAGLYAAFSTDAAPFAAVIGCDMPFFSAAMLRWQYDTLIASSGDAAIPLTEQGMEPLHAVYRRETCRDAVKASLDSANYRLNSWVPSVRLCKLKVEEWTVFDPQRVAFMNVNSPEEFAEAEALAARFNI